MPQRCAIWKAATVVLALGLLIVTLAVAQSEPPKAPTTRPATQPTTQAAVEPADNSYCLVCHINFKDEELTKQHEPAGIGCEQCHGQSPQHSADENGITPPQIMYPKDKINAACTKCHPAENLPRAATHTPVVLEILENQKTCTECHGKHTMSVRTRRWDKTTGKLIQDDGVRMVQENK